MLHTPPGLLLLPLTTTSLIITSRGGVYNRLQIKCKHGILLELEVSYMWGVGGYIEHAWFCSLAAQKHCELCNDVKTTVH